MDLLVDSEEEQSEDWKMVPFLKLYKQNYKQKYKALS